MMPSHSPVRPSKVLRADSDPDSLAALVRSSRRLGRFWPPLASGPEPVAASPAGVEVPAGAQRLVAGMPDYGG
ncbi:hypothetical protein AB0D08_01250 [Kitasatospora sp. NPDC048540]|uniref:hypothetical protein n=1 Tax=unclassified Kitasatospora TaxID=2633591 RepID=UPI00068D6A71|nr:hypothetical protein [Kitasatospora sp. MBT63]